MKKTICNLIWVLLFGCFVFCPAMAVAHGGGGGGDGGGGDAADAYSNSSEDYLMGGGVSWEENKNIRGPSVYDKRDPNIEKGPYQPGTSVEDAEALLLAGYQAGNYTAEELLEQLTWAQGVKIPISESALQVLDQMAVEMQQILDAIDKAEKDEKERGLDNESVPSSTQTNLTEEDDGFAMFFLAETYDMIATMAAYKEEQRRKGNNSKSSSTKNKDENLKEIERRFKDLWESKKESGGTITGENIINILQGAPIQKK